MLSPVLVTCALALLLPSTACNASPLDPEYTPLPPSSPPTKPAQTYALCQQISNKPSPLHGCPKGTIYVSADTSCPRANFHSIQAAIASIPNNKEPYTILIAPGIYTEQLNITRPGPLTLLGASDLPSQDRALTPTTSSYLQTHGESSFDYSAPLPSNAVQIYWNSRNSQGVPPTFIDNAFTSVLTVAPTLNASFCGTGPQGWPVDPSTPFGSTDFRAYNIDFRNEWAPRSSGPAQAVGISRANAGFYSCGMYSWQDTVFVGKLGNAYFHDTIVAGQTDFLYGFGTLYISKSLLSLRSCGGGVTAWKGTNRTTHDNPVRQNDTPSPFSNKYGVYISETSLLATNDTVAPEIRAKCSLGRPWNDLHRSVVMDSFLDSSILPAGYTGWEGKPPNNNGIGQETVMAVYSVFGDGADVDAMKAGNVTKVWGQAEVRGFRGPREVFMDEHGRQPDVQWLDPVVWKQ